MFGITLCGKNHFGSVRSGGSWSPSPLHDYGRRENGMGTYNCLVDLIGYKHLGGKTLLYMVDGLYPARNQGADVVRYESQPFKFNGGWCSSIFTSQDPVAIDSVGLDFLRAEQETPNSRLTDVIGNPDNYLHEAAQANNPPSGTFYDPDHAGNVSRLPSLGVHEHWNNAIDKQYSRNLGTGNGIELWRKPLAPDVDLSGDGIVNFVDYSTLVQYWLQSESLVDVAPLPDGDGVVDSKDVALLAENWLRVTTIPPLPEPASNPYPPSGATGVTLIADLSWTAGADAISQDVYLGTISPGTFQGNQTNTTFDPGIMTLNTTYYWRIDQVNEWGKTTGTVWRFTTTGGPPPP